MDKRRRPRVYIVLRKFENGSSMIGEIFLERADANEFLYRKMESLNEMLEEGEEKWILNKKGHLWVRGLERYEVIERLVVVSIEKFRD